MSADENFRRRTRYLIVRGENPQQGRKHYHTRDVICNIVLQHSFRTVITVLQVPTRAFDDPDDAINYLAVVVVERTSEVFLSISDVFPRFSSSFLSNCLNDRENVGS